MTDTDRTPDPDPDLLDSIIGRAAARPADRLERHMRDAGKIKTEQEAASQRRLEEMWIREHERQRRIAEAQVEQRRQEQRLVRYVLIAAAIFVLVIILLAFVFSRPAASPAPEALRLFIQHA